MARGYGRKSGGATGIGLVLFRLVLEVKPEKPVSSPVTVWLPVTEPSFSANGPKVRCLTTSAPTGSMPNW